MNNVFEKLRLAYRAHRYRLKLDRAEIAFVRSHALPGTLALDIGAHKGAYTYWMAKAVGSGGRVIAFEPQGRLAAQLGRCFSGCRTVTIENRGLSSRCDRLRLFVPGDGPSPGATFEPPQDGGGQTVEVEVSTLDSYLAHSHLPVSLIKCDVEGHELQVFYGARRILTEERPALLFESENRHLGGGDVRQVFAYLEELGYLGWFFCGTSLVPLPEFDPAIHQAVDRPETYCNNFAFLPSETAA